MKELDPEQLKNISTKEREKIRQLIEKIKNKKEDIYGLIIFGSSVDQLNYKDLDLSIVSDPDISIKTQLELRVFLPEKYDIHFFHNLPLYVQHEVLKTGIIIYMGNYNKLFDECMKSIKDWALFEPHFKKYLELIKNY